MCAVIGAILKEPKQSTLELLVRVFHESSIRGRHATGYSFICDNTLLTYSYAKPSRDIINLDLIKMMINDDGNLYLIGHCRYSTSDLKYNQPLSNEDISIVHNGVMSQELSENWEKLYGFKTNTKNDSELLLKTIEKEESPFSWENASIAAIELHRKEKKLVYYRNGKRPLYHTDVDNGTIITSTKDIMYRASNGQYSAIDTSYNAITSVWQNMTKVDLKNTNHGVDLQNV